MKRRAKSIWSVQKNTAFQFGPAWTETDFCPEDAHELIALLTEPSLYERIEPWKATLKIQTVPFEEFKR